MVRTINRWTLLVPVVRVIVCAWHYYKIDVFFYVLPSTNQLFSVLHILYLITPIWSHSSSDLLNLNICLDYLNLQITFVWLHSSLCHLYMSTFFVWSHSSSDHLRLHVTFIWAPFFYRSHSSSGHLYMSTFFSTDHIRLHVTFIWAPFFYRSHSSSDHLYMSTFFLQITFVFRL